MFTLSEKQSLVNEKTGISFPWNTKPPAMTECSYRVTVRQQQSPWYLQFCQMSPLLQIFWPLHVYIPCASCIDMPDVAQLLHSGTAALPGFQSASFHCSFVSFLNAIHTNFTVNASLH